jgi:hypothetical protein
METMLVASPSDERGGRLQAADAQQPFAQPP